MLSIKKETNRYRFVPVVNCFTVNQELAYTENCTLLHFLRF